jgi:hypothetical protein
VADDVSPNLALAATTISTETGSGERKVRAYWELGRLLHEQLGDRAAYGQGSVASLAKRLRLLPRTLYRARLFYQRLPNLTTWSGLTWSHCRVLITLEQDEDRQNLVVQTREQGWSVRQLQAQVRLREKGSAPPRRGRLWTYRLLPTRKELDLGFGVHLAIAALGPLTQRAHRLLDTTSQSMIVELAMTEQGTDLRPVWGAAQQRLYTYRLTDPQILADGQFVGRVELGPHVAQRMRLTLTGVPELDAPKRKRLARILEQMQLAICVDEPGPAAQVDLFGHSHGAATGQQILADGQHINSLLQSPPSA